MEGFVKFKLSYGGKFVENPDAQYVGGSTEILTVDRDRISLLDFQDFVEQEGYKDVAAFYYKFPKTHLAFRQKLETDIDVMDMLDLLKDGELVEIYVEHAREFNEETNAIVFQSDEAGVDEAKIGDIHAENIVDTDAGDAFTGEMPECTFENVESMDEADEQLDSSDMDDMFCEPAEDENIEQIRVNVSQSLNQVFSTRKDADKPDELLNDKDYVPLEELISDSELSEKEDGKKHHRWFNEKIDFQKDIELSVGMKFRDANVFRSALRELAVKKKLDFDYINNKSGRISAQCRNQKCPWRIAASRHVDNEKVSMHCNVTYGGGHSMEVEHTIHGSFVVNVFTRSCTCRIWDLTGIPCCHACAAIRQMRGNPADYVHQSYRKSKFMKAYDYHIQPIPGPTEWPQQEGVRVLPPLFRRQAGRPRRRRIREVGEPINVHKKSKSGIIITCGRCGSVGHNARRCKGDIADPRKAEQRKKNVARAAKNRTRKKQATNGSGDGDGKLKKANVRRKKKVEEPIMIRESQVSTNEQQSRDWHSEYDIVGNATPYEKSIFDGHLQVPVRGGQAMFRRATEGSSANDQPSQSINHEK